jgi:hypothetical protein
MAKFKKGMQELSIKLENYFWNNIIFGMCSSLWLVLCFYSLLRQGLLKYILIEIRTYILSRNDFFPLGISSNFYFFSKLLLNM